jgi:ATP-dependent RNA helicase DDX51/DBP6
MAGHKTRDSSKGDVDPNSAKSHKRKRDQNVPQVATTPTPTKKHKKRESLSTEQSTEHDDGSTKRRKRLKEALQGEDSPQTSKKESAVSANRSKESTTDSRHDVSETGKKSKSGKRKSTNKSDKLDDEVAPVNADSDDDEVEAEPKTSKNKHSGILSKFERTKTVASSKSKKPEPETVEDETPAVEPVFAQGLEPLPQPENPPELEQLPTYSSLPPWLANPLRKSADVRSEFSELGIKPDLLKILRQHDYKEAFAVQSTVIPLLLQGEQNHPGDLCISAATGSGKTLSYVLPLVTALTPRPASRLRGLIVVPTRELVKQAREACELCATGSRLHIGSAVGNVAIKDEQKQLMRVDQVYNPAIQQQQRDGLVGNDWMNLSLENCVSEAVDSNGSLPGYIQRSEPNVDILICTPGRLVDHIRYTKGFTLQHLEWLVIDEADRLLNESFQEWVDVIMHSLDSRQAPETFGPGGKLLSELGLSIEAKPPRKVILSATMTRDISKLNSLRLANPKMIIIGSEDASNEEDLSANHADAHFALPPTLSEHIVQVGDGSLKPLYLLRLLLSHIDLSGDLAPNVSDSSDSDSTSSDDTSDDDTSSDESSDDDTSSSGSDSESESHTDSESGSSSDSDSSDESSDADSESDAMDLVPEPTRKTVLIFTKSSESASRLSRLISLLHPPLAKRVGTIIKSNKSSASRKTLTAYRQGRISIIVATDRASRGLDLHSLTHVVNYDIPTSVTTYVHRVGRTARAGRAGSAWSLVAHREGRWFANEIAASVNGRITRTSNIDRVQIKPDSLGSLKPKYAKALDKLEKEVKRG